MDTKMFDRALQSFVKKYDYSVEYSVKKVGFELLRRAMLRTTRVCTGRMRSGWHISYHRPSSWEPKTGKEKAPNLGIDMSVKTLFVQNNVFYAIYHEVGTVRLQPLLMLTVPVQEMRAEMAKYLLKGTEPLWNKEINGVTGFGLTKEGRIAKGVFLKKFPRTAKRGVCSKTKKRKRSK